MAIFGGLLDFVLVVFLVLVFAEYTKIKEKAAKQFHFMAGGALWLLVAYLFKTGTLAVFNNVGSSILYGQYLFEFLGWLLFLIGSIWAGYVLLTKK